MVPALLLIAAAHGSLHFIEDDHSKALAAARADHKPLFVDLWATWCHSCLSMQRFVLDGAAGRRCGARPRRSQVDGRGVRTRGEADQSGRSAAAPAAQPVYVGAAARAR